MLPDRFQWSDPSKIVDQHVGDFFDHVIAMENPDNQDTDGQPRRFRFSHYHAIVDGVPKYLPAIYPEVVAPNKASRRSKKTVRPPTFVTSPDDNHIATGGSVQPAQSVSPTSGTRCPLFQPSQKRVKELNVAARATARRQAKAKKSQTKARGGRKKKAIDAEEWETDEEMEDDDGDGVVSDYELRDRHLSDDGGDMDDLPDEEDDSDRPQTTGVRGSRRVAGGPGKGKGRATAVEDARSTIPGATSPNGPLLPCSVGASGPTRFEYLRGLCANAEYQAMLNRHRSKVRTMCRSLS